jgi:hypothetical protein
MIKNVNYNLKLSMRALVCFISASSVAYPTLRQADPAENPLSIAVQFASGNATFKLANGVARTIDIRVGEKLYTMDLAGCTRVENIHFETTQFFNGPPGRGTFTLTFRMGAEDSAAFGKLPWVQIAFNDGRRVGAIVTRQTDLSSETTSPLCRNQPADPSAR